MSAKALIEFHDVLRVWIEFRAPKKGELAWSVPANATPEEALDHMFCGRDDWSSGEAGFGYRVHRDMPEFETIDQEVRDARIDEGEDLGDSPTRNIVVHVEHVRTEPHLNNIIPHVKLL
jgi:hypothetical protein